MKGWGMNTCPEENESPIHGDVPRGLRRVHKVHISFMPLPGCECSESSSCKQPFRNALLLWHRPILSLNLHSNPRAVRKLAQLNGTKTRRWEKWKQTLSSALPPTEDLSWGRKDNLNNLKLWLWNMIRYFLISKLKFSRYYISNY